LKSLAILWIGLWNIQIMKLHENWFGFDVMPQEADRVTIWIWIWKEWFQIN
jgi:hypothetical protein